MRKYTFIYYFKMNNSSNTNQTGLFVSIVAVMGDVCVRAVHYVHKHEQKNAKKCWNFSCL